MAEYAEAMAAGAVFPPLVVFHDGDRHWLAEGFHRHAAGLAAGLTELPCDVRPGGLRDAILHSAGANADHGVRRTIPDRRRAVLMIVQDPEWGNWSDREIARRCAVSADLVGTVRRELTVVSDSEPSSRTYRDRHGNVTQMDTARIGRRTAEPRGCAATRLSFRRCLTGGRGLRCERQPAQPRHARHHRWCASPAAP